MGNFILFVTLFGLLFVAIDVLQRFVLTHVDWARKATHIGAGVISYFLPDFLNRNMIVGMAILFTILLIISRLKNILTLHKVSRFTIGEIVYPVSIGVLALISLPQNTESFKLGILVLSMADGFAGVLGERIKFIEIKILDNKKSIGGSLTFIIITFLSLLIVFGATPEFYLKYILLSLGLAIIEFFTIYGFDNLIVPVLATLLSNYLFYF